MQCVVRLGRCPCLAPGSSCQRLPTAAAACHWYFTTSAASFCVVCDPADAAVSGAKLVKSGGQVKYTFTFTAGTAVVPINSTLSLSTVAGPPPMAPVCTTTNLTLTPDVGDPRIAITDAKLLASDLLWDCSFVVDVTETHRASGLIDAFTVKLEVGGPQITKAFYIPQLAMPVVYVYTGGFLTIDGTMVKTDGQEGVHYHDSECP